MGLRCNPATARLYAQLVSRIKMNPDDANPSASTSNSPSASEQSQSDQGLPAQEALDLALPGPSIPIANISTANENWRGKNDPAERRRIQNRLNQRAFRQRQREGGTPRSYRPRSSSGPSQTPRRRRRREQREESVSGSESTTSIAARVEPRSASAPAPASDAPVGVADRQTGLLWDELGGLINRNFMAAAVTNAEHLGISPLALQEGTPQVLAQRSPTRRGGEGSSSDGGRNNNIPASLLPNDLQYQVPHDPIIDIIPHRRLRYNILRAIASGRFDPSPLYRCLRETGALEVTSGSWQRRGVVLWGTPEDPNGWELSESFVRRWSRLLDGCADLLETANGWRRRRGERTLELPATASGSGSAGPSGSAT